MDYSFTNEEREAFFDRHFDYESEDAENAAVASKVFEESAAKVREMTEQLSDGEAVDEPTFVLELSKMILSHEYQKKFES